mmetsp:Transcript_36713/g.51893  ORF Transcript_36713/g.51893 Transcript_36713/m.51893 type:complete len:233 (-) Transcript_36713:891-1589(-)
MKLATTILKEGQQEDFELHTNIDKLLTQPDGNTDKQLTAKVLLELTATILIHLAPFLTNTPLKEKQHKIKQLKIKNDIQAYLKTRETTDTTEKIDAVLTENSDDKEAALKKLIASETSLLTRKIASLEGQVKQQRKKSTQRDTAKTSSTKGQTKSPTKFKRQPNTNKTNRQTTSPKVTFQPKSSLKPTKKGNKANQGGSVNGGTKEKKKKKKQGASSKKNSSDKKKNKQEQR